MILVRNVFRLKFGKAKESTQLWKEGLQIGRKSGLGNARVLTDVVGTSYTVVFETVHENLADWEAHAKKMMSQDEWQKWYQKFVPLAESGYREIFTIIEP